MIHGLTWFNHVKPIKRKASSTRQIPDFPSLMEPSIHIQIHRRHVAVVMPAVAGDRADPLLMLRLNIAMERSTMFNR